MAKKPLTKIISLKAGLTQAKMALALGIPRRTIENYEQCFTYGSRPGSSSIHKYIEFCNANKITKDNGEHFSHGDFELEKIAQKLLRPIIKKKKSNL